MKIKNYVCKCGSTDFDFLDRGFNVGIYCMRCGKWFKWASHDELNLMKMRYNRK